MLTPLLSVANLTKRYGASTVVDDVSFTIARGETLGLVGESGSGKSTVARMLLRLVEPSSGSVHFDQNDVLQAKPRELRALRRRMQMVFQDPFASLNPRMRIREIVAEPFAIQGGFRREEVRDRTRALMEEVGLAADVLERWPHEFSGGQRQRISIARALALRPEFLALDEPVSALDVSVGAQVINLLRDLQRTHGLTYLFISHSMPLVRYLCDRVAVMERGRLVELGETLQVCDHPREAYTQRLIAATPRLPGAFVAGTNTEIPGCAGMTAKVVSAGRRAWCRRDGGRGVGVTAGVVSAGRRACCRRACCRRYGVRGAGCTAGAVA